MHALPDEEIIDSYLSGDSENVLAKRYGVSRRAIRLRIVRAGITPRGQSEAETVKWSRMSKARRSKQVAAAHVARRGQVDSVEVKTARAETRFAKGVGIGPWETVFAELLDAAGIKYQQQTPCGHYCIDFTLAVYPIAVEIRTGNGNGYTRINAQARLESVLDEWNLFVVDIKNLHRPAKRIVPEIVEYLVAFTKLCGRNHSAPGHHWVIRADGRPILPSVEGKYNRWAAIPSPDELLNFAIRNVS